MEAVGSEDGSEEAEVAAHVPFETIVEALATMITNEGKTLTPLQKGHVAKFVKALRREFVDGVAVPALVPGPAVGQNIVLQMPDTSDKLQLKDYLGQTILGSFELLPAFELTQLRRNFVRTAWGGAYEFGEAFG